MDNQFTKWKETLDEIIRAYERDIRKLPSKTTVLELIKWLRKKSEVK